MTDANFQGHTLIFGALYKMFYPLTTKNPIIFCLFKDPLTKSPVCSDWLALTGLSMHCQPFFSHISLANLKPSCLFKGTVSEYRLCGLHQ